MLSAEVATDPNAKDLTLNWTYSRTFGSTSKCSLNALAKASQVDTPETVHGILATTNKETPALTRYQRVILTVHP
ncbi:hypothetical protein [Fibrella forsythiae]|uniref:Cellulose-binding Sde182 C-terminal domain-containing protein n=1 Tax=Fibrella forsythiae TaxID=2817061 RepID=A0ABS3JF44_9BACT|nr:hypothetical protein [Fibrella forsythiae]MBO0948612.1 hypothetical protein [Fibrella forsythiae]